MNYITTNIRIPEEDYFRLKEEAAKKRKSLSAVVRERIKKKQVSPKDYRKLLLSLKTDCFTEKYFEEIKENRKQLEERFKKYNW